MKKVLIIAYIFPPIGGSGVQRTLKFARYLPQFGWQPIVVCGDDGSVFDDGLDPSLVEEIPSEAIVHRVRFRSPLALRRWVQRALRIHEPGKADAQLQNTPAALHGTGERPRSRLRRLMQLLSAPLGPFEFPPVDAALYWSYAIIPLCLKLIRQGNVDVIYSTSFPYSDHVAGWILKRLTGKPWVADFRDLWAENIWSKNSGWRHWVDRRIEQRVLNTADRVISVTPTFTRILSGLAPNRNAEHFITIENGYDADDFRRNGHAPDFRQPGKTVIAHLGMVYNGIALPVLNALNYLTREQKELLELRFVGGIAEKEQQFLNSNRASLPVQVSPRVSHDQVMQVMTSIDILLLLISTRPGWDGHYPGKIFEYMASGKPVLMIGPDGEAANLIKQSGTGCFIQADDEQSIAETLRLIACDPAEFRARHYHPNPEVIARYERRDLTASLSAVFEDLVDSKR